MEHQIVTHETINLPVNLLTPHPLNRPATGIKREQVDTLKTLIAQNGFNASKALTVRKHGNGYQIIEGNHRWLSATELGFTELPCVVEDLDDIDANIRLLIGNQQEGNDPLDIGLNALETVEKSKGGRGVKSELSVSGFAGRLGKSQQYISQVVQAATVYRKLTTQVVGFDVIGRVKHLFEIHSAPEHTWPTLATLLQEHGWNVKEVKAAVDRVKAIHEARPSWWPTDLSEYINKVAIEPGFAKSTAAALSAMREYHDKLSESVTLYELSETDQVKAINGREHKKYDPSGFEYYPRKMFIAAVTEDGKGLSAKNAESSYKKIVSHIDRNSQADETWRPVLTDAEEKQRQKRLAEIAALQERESFMPRMVNDDVVSGLRSCLPESFDLVCADPPYNMDKAEWDSYGSGQDFASWCNPWMAECYRILKDTGSIYIFGKNRMLAHLMMEMEKIGFVYQNWLTWDTIQGQGGGLWRPEACEGILYFSKTGNPYEDAESVKMERHEEHVREYKGREYKFKNVRAIWRIPCVDDKHHERTEHPTQKPVELIERIVVASCPREGRVMDCFIGSGTTGVACMKNRRHCVGIDKSKDYLEIAQSRFDKTEIGA